MISSKIFRRISESFVMLIIAMGAGAAPAKSNNLLHEVEQDTEHLEVAQDTKPTGRSACEHVQPVLEQCASPSDPGINEIRHNHSAT